MATSSTEIATFASVVSNRPQDVGEAMKPMRYNGILSFNHTDYIVSKDHMDQETATAAANVIAEQVRQVIVYAGEQILQQYELKT
jgi:hypothetical protein